MARKEPTNQLRFDYEGAFVGGCTDEAVVNGARGSGAIKLIATELPPISTLRHDEVYSYLRDPKART